MTSEIRRCGFLAIVGRPNVGKSTLLNRLVGQKVSITSARPQTTRHRILGIKTVEDAQFVFVDTPGLHANNKKAMNQYMNRAATGSIEGVDAIVLTIAAPLWRPEDEYVLALLAGASAPVVLAINQIDRFEQRAQALPLIAESAEKYAFSAIVPVSAKTGANVAELEATLSQYLPQQGALFDVEQVTDRSERFLAAEAIREQVFRGFGQELPYAATVAIEQFKDEPKLIRIDATIWVEKDGQKAILIGKDGERLKKIGTRARMTMERQLDKKVFLSLWVKVRDGWSDDLRALQSLGYQDDN